MSDSAFAIAFTPLLPWPAIVVLGGLAFAFGALALWRRRRVGGGVGRRRHRHRREPRALSNS